MNSAALLPPSELERVERAVPDLLTNFSRLSRLLFPLLDSQVSRSEAIALNVLDNEPRRITELATWVGLAQPRATVLIRHLEEKGLVTRHTDEHDKRAVIASLTDEGRQVVHGNRHRAIARIAEGLAGTSDTPGHTAEQASESLSALLTAVQAVSTARGVGR